MISIEKKLENNVKITALVIIAIGFGLRLYRLTSESLWYDELLELDIASGSLVEIFPRLRQHTGVPLDYIIAHYWILWGRSEAWVRLPAVLWGTLALPVAYQLGRRMLGRSEGLIFMALLTFSAFHVRYSQEVRPYALLVLGVLLAVYAYWQLRTTGKWPYFLLLQAGVLIFSLAHIFAMTIFLPFSIFAGLDLLFNRDRKRALQVFVALLLTSLAPLLILLTLGWSDILFYSSVQYGEALVQPEKFTVESAETPIKGLGSTVDWLFVRNKILAPLASSGTTTAILFSNGLAGLGLLYLLIRKRFSLALLLLLWLVLPAAIIVSFLEFRGTFFASRYIISTLPAYFLLLTAGIIGLPRWLGKRQPGRLSALLFLIISSLILLNLLTTLQRLYVEQINEDWRVISHFLARNAATGDAIIAANAESWITWYFPTAYVPGDQRDRIEAIRTVADQAERSWIIVSIFTDNFNNDSKIKAWLSEQGAIRLDLDPIIGVYYRGQNTDQAQLLEEIQGFALPANAKLYASLARENRRRPEIARQYYRLAIDYAPDEASRAEYQAALEALER